LSFDGLMFYQRGWCCAQLVSAAVRRGRRRPMICFLAFLRSGEGQRAAAQLLAGRSFDTAKGKERPPRGSRCRFIKTHGQSCEAVGLGRSACVRRSPMFSRLHAQPGAAPCASPRIMAGADLRLVALAEGSESTIGLVQCNLLAAARLPPLSCRSAAAPLPLDEISQSQLPKANHFLAYLALLAGPEALSRPATAPPPPPPLRPSRLRGSLRRCAAPWLRPACEAQKKSSAFGGR
jgi:hypothetical protein